MFDSDVAVVASASGPGLVLPAVPVVPILPF